MDITTLLSVDRIMLESEVSSKKRAFELLANLLAKTQSHLNAAQIFDALINREKLGSTALGNGIAVPHARMPITAPCAALLFSREGLKMDSPDKKGIQLFLAILVPSNEASHLHSALMTELALELGLSQICAHLDHYHDPQMVMDYLIQYLRQDLAA